jgi:hypothetical protein
MVRALQRRAPCNTSKEIEMKTILMMTVFSTSLAGVAFGQSEPPAQSDQAAQPQPGAPNEAPACPPPAAAGSAAGAPMTDQNAPPVAAPSEALPIPPGHKPDTALAPANPLKPAPFLHTRYGIGAEVGGGVVGFLNPNTSNLINAGGLWDVRFQFGTRAILSAEAAYVGTAQGVSSLGVDSGAALVSNAFEGLMRLNAFTGIAQPYFAGGLSYRHYSLINTNVNTSDIADTSNVITVPLGAGIALRGAGFIFDTRLGLNIPIDSATVTARPTSQWSWSARVGYEF